MTEVKLMEKLKELTLYLIQINLENKMMHDDLISLKKSNIK